MGLSVEQRLERLEQAIAELDFQFCHVGRRHGWRPEHRAALASLREAYDAERSSEYERQVEAVREERARKAAETAAAPAWEPKAAR
jgi:hypothetical protein